MIGWLIGWLIDWLVDWLVGLVYGVLHQYSSIFQSYRDDQFYWWSSISNKVLLKAFKYF
jgi:hypothetical protein